MTAKPPEPPRRDDSLCADGSPSPLLPKTAFIFPALVWFTACFFLLGDIGRHRDDYGWHSRDPVTLDYHPGSLASFEWLTAPRPFEWYSRAINTVLYPVHQAIVLVSALAHGAVGLLLFAFLRRRVHPAAAGLAALLFLVSPPSHEAVLWPPVLSTLMGTGLLLCTLILGEDLAQGSNSRSHTPSRWLPLVALGLPLWTEQPAITFMAVAFAATWVGLPPAIRRSGLVPLAYWLSAYGLNLAAGLSFAESSPSLSEIPPRIQLIAGQTAGVFVLSSYGAVQALLEGIARFWAAGPIRWVLALGLLGGLGLWARWWRAAARTFEGDRHGPRLHLRRLGWLIFGASLLAITLRRDVWLTSRHAYLPLAGLAMVAAAWFDEFLALCRRSRHGAWISQLAFLPAALLVFTGTLMLVGVQSWLEVRHRFDQAQLARLRELIPQPRQGTVFLPVRIDFKPPSAYPPYEALPNLFESHDAFGRALMRVYGSKEVGGVALNRWVGLKPVEADERGFRVFAPAWMSPNLPPADSAWTRRFSWDQVVPFRVDQGGDVALFHRVVLEHSDLNDVSVSLPVGRPPNELAIIVPGTDERTRATPPWRSALSPAPVVFSPITALGLQRDAWPFLPLPGHLLGSRIASRLPPTSERETLCFRLAPLDAAALTAATNPLSARLVVTLEGRTVLSMEIPAARLSSAVRWLSFTVPLPARETDVDLAIALEAPAWSAAPLVLSEPRLRSFQPGDDRLESPPGPEVVQSEPARATSKAAYPEYPLLVGLTALGLTLATGYTLQAGLTAPRHSALAAALLVVVSARWVQMGPHPTGLDNGTWLLLGQKLMGEAGAFDLYSPGVFPPLVPLLLYFASKTLGIALGAKVVGIGSVALIILAVYFTSRASMPKSVAAVVALLAGSAFSITEPVAFGGYPQSFALAFLVFALRFHSLALAGEGRRRGLLATIFLSLTGLSHHAYFIAGLTVILVATGVWVVWNWRSSNLRRTLMGLPVTLALPVLLFLPTVYHLIAERYRPQINPSNFGLIDGLSYALREPVGIWLAVLGLGLLELWMKPLGGRPDATRLSATGLGIAGVGSFLVTNQPRLVPLILIAGLMGAGLLFERLRSYVRGKAPRWALAAFFVATAAALWTGSEGAARAVFPWYRVLDVPYEQTAKWLTAQKRKDLTAINQGHDGAPVGWWFQPLADTPLAVGSDPRWLAFPAQFERARVVKSLFDRTVGWGEAARRGREGGVGLLVTRKADWPDWESWARSAAGAVVFENSHFIVFDVRLASLP